MFTVNQKVTTKDLKTGKPAKLDQKRCLTETARLGETLTSLLVYSYADGILKVLSKVDSVREKVATYCGLPLSLDSLNISWTEGSKSCNEYATTLSDLGQKIMFNRSDKVLMIKSLAEAFEHVPKAIQYCQQSEQKSKDLQQQAKKMQTFSALNLNV